MARTPNMAVGIDLNVPIAVRTAEGTQDDVITLVHDAFGLTPPSITTGSRVVVGMSATRRGVVIVKAMF